MKLAQFHADAEQELAEAIAWYDAQRAGLGERFQEAVEKAVLHIRRFPKAGSRYDRYGTRKHVMRGFPYNVYYFELPETIWIVAVAHQRRRPGYWHRRRSKRPGS
jgi:plasmid stabilization system protein ParE